MSRRSKSRNARAHLRRTANLDPNEERRKKKLERIQDGRYSPGDMVVMQGQQYMCVEDGSLRKVSARFLEKRRMKKTGEEEAKKKEEEIRHKKKIRDFAKKYGMDSDEFKEVLKDA